MAVYSIVAIGNEAGTGGPRVDIGKERGDDFPVHGIQTERGERRQGAIESNIAVVVDVAGSTGLPEEIDSESQRD